METATAPTDEHVPANEDERDPQRKGGGNKGGGKNRLGLIIGIAIFAIPAMIVGYCWYSTLPPSTETAQKVLLEDIRNLRAHLRSELLKNGANDEPDWEKLIPTESEIDLLAKHYGQPSYVDEWIRVNYDHATWFIVGIRRMHLLRDIALDRCRTQGNCNGALRITRLLKRLRLHEFACIVLADIAAAGCCPEGLIDDTIDEYGCQPFDEDEREFFSNDTMTDGDENDEDDDDDLD